MDRQTPSLARTAWTGRLLYLQGVLRILGHLDHLRWSVGSFSDEFEAVRAGVLKGWLGLRRASTRSGSQGR